MTESAQEIKPREKRKARFAWYPRYPADYQSGTRHLSPAARGVYSDILDLIYMEGGPVRNCNRWLSCALHVRPSTWLKLRKELFDDGKLVLTPDGTGITNPRARDELQERSDRSEKRASRKPKKPRLGVIDGGKKSTPIWEKVVPKVDSAFGPFVNEIKDRDSTESESQHTNRQESSSTGENPTPVESPSTVEARPGGETGEWIDHAVYRRLLLEAGGGVIRESVGGFLSLSTPYSWLRQCDLQLDILPTIRALCADQRVKDDPPYSWDFFTKQIARAKKKRERPLPAVDARVSSGKSQERDAEYRRMLDEMGIGGKS